MHTYNLILIICDLFFLIRGAAMQWFILFKYSDFLDYSMLLFLLSNLNNARKISYLEKFNESTSID